MSSPIPHPFKFNNIFVLKKASDVFVIIFRSRCPKRMMIWKEKWTRFRNDVLFYTL